MKSAHFPKLFEPIKIQNVEFRNRIVMPSMENGFAEENGTVSERTIAYYRERAKGGAGWIIVEATYIAQQGRARRFQLAVDRDETIPGLKRLVDAVHSHGAKISLQINHAGRQASSALSGERIVSASPIACTPKGEVPKPLEKEEINKIIASFGRAAFRAKEAGFDGVEIHGAHGYLIHQFVSSLSNQRTDDYGGTLKNRMRLALEVLKEVRRSVGDEFLIGYRISASDYVEGGLKIEETLKVAQALEKKGIDVLHASAGMANLADSGCFVTPPMAIPRGIHLPLAEAMKKGLAIPVIAVGRINTPELAEKILEEGKADFIAMGRAFLTDPLWPSKVLSGRTEDIRICIACNECVARLGQHLSIVCTQNPVLGKESEIEIKKAPKKKKVIIVGGGPGGLEAARICALRGHEVILYDEGKELGGRLLSASLPPYKEEVGGILNYQIRQVRSLPIEIHLRRKIDAAFLASSKPDAVVIATGSIPIDLMRINGVAASVPNGDQKVLYAEDVLQGAEVKGSKVAIIGGGMIGCEVADFLTKKRRRVFIIEMLDDVAMDMSSRPRWLLLRRLQESGGVEILVKTKVNKIEGQTVFVEKDGHPVELGKMNEIVLAVGYKPNSILYDSLKGKIAELYTIGDCVKPRKALEAIHEGFEVGLKI